MHELQPVDSSPSLPAALGAQRPGDELLATFLRGRSPRTIAAYGKDLEVFRAHLGAASIGEALGAVIAAPQGEANRIALGFRDAMSGAGLAPATVNRRLAAIRSAVKLARVLGHTVNSLEIPGLRAEAYRDVTGPSVGALQVMLDAARADGDSWRAARDVAALRLTFDLALRRAELCGLRFADIDGDRVWLLRKGKRQRIAKTMPPATIKAVHAWLTIRRRMKVTHDLVFVSLSNCALGAPLSTDGWHKIVTDLGKRVGIRVHPHAIRHASITAAAVATGGNMVDVQEHSGHANIATARRYVAAAQDTAGRVAAMVAGALE